MKDRSISPFANIFSSYSVDSINDNIHDDCSRNKKAIKSPDLKKVNVRGLVFAISLSLEF